MHALSMTYIFGCDPKTPQGLLLSQLASSLYATSLYISFCCASGILYRGSIHKLHQEDLLCFGWQNSGMQSRDRNNMTLLGDTVGTIQIQRLHCCWRGSNKIAGVAGSDESAMVAGVKPLVDLVLSNKLVVYDLDNQTIGWTEYNCSSSIKLKDEVTGSVHLVGAHSLSSACGLSTQRALISLLLIAALLYILDF
ncbi:unnamed protein product [Ilex paraguariensis]|uniref:Peptidase A1 domain-containing protein n=1 Tax=Ilex paraguariensis TaxID=185542 RepID=A0ABC8RHX4_9AQUA